MSATTRLLAALERTTTEIRKGRPLYLYLRALALQGTTPGPTGPQGAASPLVPPPPKVSVIINDTVPVAGLTRQGDAMVAYGQVVIGLDGVPTALYDPLYDLRAELVRYTVNRKKGLGPGQPYKKIGQTMAHPSTDGAPPGPTGGGTTNGLGPGVVRVTEWSMSSLPIGGTVTLNAADIFLPFFDYRVVEDFDGNTAKALVYHLVSRTNRKKPTGVWSYAPNPFRAKFRFRFSYLDPVSGRRINGGLSEPVFVRPRKWPTRPKNVSADYPHLHAISNKPQESYYELVIGLGGVVR